MIKYKFTFLVIVVALFTTPVLPKPSTGQKRQLNGYTNCQ